MSLGRVATGHERWPRAPHSKRKAELHGDMFEMSLALGYLGDARQFRRQHGEVPEGRRSRKAPDVVARAVTTARHTVTLLYNADKTFENVAVVFEQVSMVLEKEMGEGDPEWWDKVGTGLG